MNTQERLKQRAQEEWDRKPHLHGCFSCFEAFSWAFCCGVIVYRDEVRGRMATADAQTRALPGSTLAQFDTPWKIDRTAETLTSVILDEHCDRCGGRRDERGDCGACYGR
jgi:hypothetical protein